MGTLVLIRLLVFLQICSKVLSNFHCVPSLAMEFENTQLHGAILQRQEFWVHQEQHVCLGQPGSGRALDNPVLSWSSSE